MSVGRSKGGEKRKRKRTDSRGRNLLLKGKYKLKWEGLGRVEGKFGEGSSIKNGVWRKAERTKYGVTPETKKKALGKKGSLVEVASEIRGCAHRRSST